MKYNMELVNHEVKFYKDGKIATKDTFKIGHYTVNRITGKYADGFEVVSIGVRTDKEYFPEIYYEDAFFSIESKPEFKIQTTAYGAKSIEDIEKIVAGYQEAIEVVKVLTKTFC